MSHYHKVCAYLRRNNITDFSKFKLTHDLITGITNVHTWEYEGIARPALSTLDASAVEIFREKEDLFSNNSNNTDIYVLSKEFTEGRTPSTSNWYTLDVELCRKQCISSNNPNTSRIELDSGYYSFTFWGNTSTSIELRMINENNNVIINSGVLNGFVKFTELRRFVNNTSFKVAVKFNESEFDNPIRFTLFVQRM